MSTTFQLDTPNFNLPYEAIADVCRRYGVRELAVFGSVLRPDFRSDSDIDFVVEFRSSDLGPWMEKLGRFENDLTFVLGRKADVVLRSSVEAGWNYIRRRDILDSAKTVYAT